MQIPYFALFYFANSCRPEVALSATEFEFGTVEFKVEVSQVITLHNEGV